VFKSDVRNAFPLMPLNPLWQIWQAVTVDGKYHIGRYNTAGSRAGGWIWGSFMSLALWTGAEVKGIPDLLRYIDNDFGWEFINNKKFYRSYNKYLPTKQAHYLKLWDELGIPHDESKQLFGRRLCFVGLEGWRWRRGILFMFMWRVGECFLWMLWHHCDAVYSVLLQRSGETIVERATDGHMISVTDMWWVMFGHQHQFFRLGQSLLWCACTPILGWLWKSNEGYFGSGRVLWCGIVDRVVCCGGTRRRVYGFVGEREDMEHFKFWNKGGYLRLGIRVS